MSEHFPKILIIPIDNRPVCYDINLQAAEIFKGVNVFLPDISLLGDLNKDADIFKIQNWTQKVLNENKIDIAIIALDTVAYGGLISSRRTPLSFDDVKKNIDKYVNILKNSNKDIKIYAVSSIMRISNNNVNEEEKSYWDKYGRDIFRFSYLSHKMLKNYDVELEAELIKLAKSIPFEVVDDYLNTRKRNFEINSYYIDLVKLGIIDKLVFSQDDTAEFGFNVEEKELLQKQAQKELISEKVTIKTGADEMILALLARSLADYFDEKVHFTLMFFQDNVKNIISRYEDVSIEQSAKAAIELCGGNILNSEDSIKLLINAPNKVQDEICLEIFEDEKNEKQAENLIDYINKSNSKFAIADIKNANGADNHLIKRFTECGYNPDRFYGFGAWNTTGNTFGTVIAVAVIKELSRRFSQYDENAFKKMQYVRFMDDWAYQANVRKVLRTKGDVSSVVEEMAPYKKVISGWLAYKNETTYSFPWNRTFEIKINM